MSFFVSDSIKGIVEDIESDLNNATVVPIALIFVQSGDIFKVNSFNSLKKTIDLTIGKDEAHKLLHNMNNRYSIELSLFGVKCLEVNYQELKFNQIKENDNNLIDLEILIKE